jgi:uncharacterized membrane protein YbhN (UPF0104 family)
MASPPPSPPAAARSRWRGALVALLTLSALAVLAIFLIRNRGYIAAHYALRPEAFFAIAALVVATLALRGLAHQVLFGRMGISASAFDWFRLVTVSSFTNYLPLSAGMVAKAFFLKRVHSLPYRTFAVGQVALLVVIMSTNGAVGLATLALDFPEHVAGIVGGGFAVMTAAAALMFLPTAAVRRLSGRWLAWEATAALEIRLAWPAVALLQVGILVGTAATLRIAFGMGSSNVGFAACVVFAAASMLARLVSVTPGALGIREFLVGGLAHLTGFSLRDAVIAATAVRTVEIAVIFALGGIFTHHFSGQVISSYEDREEG